MGSTAGECDVEVGARVVDTDGHPGTVRFVGLIPASPAPTATWVGVEWDDPSRGKYDGSIYGERYFTCAPGAGSFVRPSKLSRGAAFAEVLAERYTTDTNRPHIRVHCSNILRRDDASGAFVNLRNVDLSKCRIARAGAGLAELCPNLTTLNLAGNLIGAWDEVALVLNSLPRLTHLNLSDNALQPPNEPIAAPACALELGCLILDNTRLPWATVNELLALLPNLTELHLRANQYAAPEFARPHAGINFLNFSANRVRDWALVQGMQLLPALKTLLLCQNPLETISNAEVSPAQALPELEVLSLDHTLLASWDSIDALNELPALKEVNLASVPALESIEEEERRKFCIARLERIQKLNRSGITAAERESAERFFVRFHSQSAVPPPAYLRLRDKHGDLRPLADISLKPADATIPVIFDENPVEGFQLDMTLELWEFLLQIAQHLHKTADQLEVFHKSPYDFTKLTHMERRLYSFRILEGDEVHVFTKRRSPKPKVRGVR